MLDFPRLMTLGGRRAAFCMAAGLLLIGAPCHATVLGVNLITNPGAESDLANWAATSTFETVAYDVGGGFPLSTDPGPADRGTKFFSGGTSGAVTTANQSISFADLSAQVDAGQIQFDLSGYLGGFSSQNDHAVVTVSFLDGNSQVLGGASIGPVTALDRSSLTGMLYRETSGLVPASARTVDVVITMTRTEGTYNDGYADNLSLSVSVVPEPGSLGLLTVAGLAALTRRRVAGRRVSISKPAFSRKRKDSAAYVSLRVRGCT